MPSVSIASLSPLRPRCWMLRFLLAACIGLPAAAPAQAQAAPGAGHAEPVIDLLHTSWTAREGAPPGITGIAQTPDGWLWIGSKSGLYKFDGVRFLRAAGAQSPLTSSITTIGVLRDGRLWVGYDYGGVSLLEGGRMRHFSPADAGLPTTSAFKLTEDADGRLWLATAAGLYYFDARWHPAGEALGLPVERVHSLLLDRAGVLWARCETGLYAKPRNAARFERRMDVGGFGVLAQDLDGVVWTNGPELQSVLLVADPLGRRPPPWPERIQRYQFLFDRDGAMWYSAEEGVGRAGPGEARLRPQRTALDRGLSGNVVSALFEDRERNLWVATESGLDRFRKPRLQALPLPPHSVANARSVAGGPGSSAWIDHFVVSGPGATPRPYAPGHSQLITALYRAPDGALWGAGDGQIWTLADGGLKQLSMPPEFPSKGNLATLARDGAGAIWIRHGRRGVFRHQEGSWSKVEGLPDGAAAPATVFTTDTAGRVWIGFSNNRLAIVDRQRIGMFGPEQGLAIGAVAQILPFSGGAWLAGENGLAHFDGKRFLPILGKGDLPFTGVTGLVRGRDGGLWLNGGAGISSLARGELERALAEPGYRVRFARLDYRDGVRGAAGLPLPVPSAAVSEDGTLWFSTTGGVYAFAPDKLPRNTLVPPVLVTGLRSGATDYAPSDRTRLPAGTEMLRIDYTALSYQAPERMEFRYRLDGVDHDWREGGAERSAYYTNLGPGRYRFRVLASNNDGVWNPEEAAISFEIAPTVTQTAWFRVLCALALAGLLLGLYFWRTRRLAHRYREKLNERLAERERIARALHDTLLQSMQGLILRVQGVAKRLAPHSDARSAIEDILDQADELMAKGRDEVLDLRAHAQPDADLAESVSAFGSSLQESFGPRFTLTERGQRRALAPAAWPEIHSICREALFNAYRHAHAAQVEVEVGYDSEALELRIRDDGRGVPEEVLRAGGLPGHWGLAGMRERAQALGGTLAVVNRAGGGAELTLRVPARRAYAPASPGS